MNNLSQIRSDLYKYLNEILRGSKDLNFVYHLKSSSTELLNKLDNSELLKDLQFLDTDKSSFRRDLRSKERFLIDLYKGWVVEDAIVSWLKDSFKLDSSISFESDSCDQDRKVYCSKVTAQPDLIVVENGIEILTFDIKSVHKLYNEINIKPNKYLKSNKHACLFYISELGKFFICNPELEGIPLCSCKTWGGKLTYTYNKNEYTRRLVSPVDLLNQLQLKIKPPQAAHTV